MFQFDLETIPIPSIVLEWSQALSFRGAQQERYSVDLITADQLALLMKATTPVEANTSALDLFEARDVCQINNSPYFRGQFLEWFRRALEIVGTRQSMPWAETIVYSLSDRAVPVMGRACSVRGPSGHLDHILWSFIDVSPLKRAEQDAVEARQAAEA